MRIILTGPAGTLAYWDTRSCTAKTRSFNFRGRFKHPDRQSFARLSAFADNGNHAPSGCEVAVTSDLGLGLLHRIADAS